MKQKKLLSLTVGIPAYNEGANIKKLLKSILTQHLTNVKLEKIIVSSDGSSDNTVKEAKSISSKKVEVIQNTKRSGIARGLNQIIKRTNSDILVTLDADIQLKDINFLSKLVKPLTLGKAELTSSNIAPIMPSTFFGKIIYVSMLSKTILFSTLKNGDNVYSCYGLARGFSKRFYKKVTFPVSVGNDMYSYLMCKSLGFRFKCVKNTTAWYNLPENSKDHESQSKRFFRTSEILKSYFNKRFVENEYKIPAIVYVKASLKSLPILLKYPIHSTSYFFIQAKNRLLAESRDQNDLWHIAISTKKYE